MSFFGNVMKWLLNDLLVSKLANSKRFQYIVLNIDTFSYDMKELIGINLQNKHIVVDNSPLPVGGADS
jgi:hypothetical protein